MRSCIALLLAVVLATTAACSSTVLDAPSADAANATTEFLDDAAVQLAFDDWANTADGGGVAAIRRGRGEILTFAAGDDPQTGLALEPDALVRVGSVSKIFVAALVMQMAEAGTLDLDAPISTYLSGLDIGTDPTTRQLLAHTSGIPNYTDTQGFGAVVFANTDRALTPTNVIAFTNSESDFEPGDQFAYSNTNYIVLGLLIEHVTNQPLNTVLTERISGPLGLQHTTFDDGTTVVAGGYSGIMPSGTSFDQGYTAIASSAWAAGALVSTAEELAVFIDALFLGDLLQESSVAEMTAAIDDGADYGLGIAPGPDFGIGHGGAIIGFNSMVEIDPGTGDIVVVVVNNDMRQPIVVSSRLAEIVRGET